MNKPTHKKLGLEIVQLHTDDRYLWEALHSAEAKGDAKSVNEHKQQLVWTRKRLNEVHDSL